jgi:hypothetical protein
MSKHFISREAVPEHKRGYFWSPRQNHYGNKLAYWRLRLDKQNVAKVYEDDRGTFHLICWDRPNGSEIEFRTCGGTLEYMKEHALRWCRARYGESLEAQPTDQDAHAVLLSGQPLRTDAA